MAVEILRALVLLTHHTDESIQKEKGGCVKFPHISCRKEKKPACTCIKVPSIVAGPVNLKIYCLLLLNMFLNFTTPPILKLPANIMLAPHPSTNCYERKKKTRITWAGTFINWRPLPLDPLIAIGLV